MDGMVGMVAMVGWMDGMVGWMDGMVGWMVGWMDGMVGWMEDGWNGRLDGRIGKGRMAKSDT
jgi:hypothetical protein